MKLTLLGIDILAMCIGLGLFLTCSAHNNNGATTSWNPKAAAAYLDQREGWWMAWPPTARDHGTFCVSCHTAVPYALARPALRKVLAEEGPSPNERKLLESVTKRVRLWRDVQLFYGDDKSGADKGIQSRGSEAVLNALILASFDARNGRLSDDTRAAFKNMWTVQEKSGDEKGAWPWLDFGTEPWEAKDSGYYGASLAAVAVGTAPENYRTAPEIQDNLNLLREYLNRECTRQSAINQVLLLWASAKLPGVLDRGHRESIIKDVLSKQRADGGWSLSSLAWTWRSWTLYSLAQMWIRSEGTPLEARSDGYATGLIVLALQQAGFTRENVQLQRGLAWLVRNQNQSKGLWQGYSLKKRHAPSSDTGKFMSDAATAYAVLALTQ